MWPRSRIAGPGSADQPGYDPSSSSSKTAGLPDTPRSCQPATAAITTRAGFAFAVPSGAVPGGRVRYPLYLRAGRPMRAVSFGLSASFKSENDSYVDFVTSEPVNGVRRRQRLILKKVPRPDTIPDWRKGALMRICRRAIDQVAVTLSYAIGAPTLAAGTGFGARGTPQRPGLTGPRRIRRTGHLREPEYDAEPGYPPAPVIRRARVSGPTCAPYVDAPAQTAQTRSVHTSPAVRAGTRPASTRPPYQPGQYEAAPLPAR